MRSRLWLGLLPVALGACSTDKLSSSLPPPAAPASYVGAPVGALAPAAVERALQQLEDELEGLEDAGVPLQLSREGATVTARFGSRESFAEGSAELEPGALLTYAGLARALAARADTVAHIRVLGDAVPDPVLGLAARRAASVQAYLAARGVPGTRLRAHGGEGAAAIEVLIRPIVTGREAEAWLPPS
jgi:outer membrane protein OmpA-like peptidoglycan-associated protein